MTLSDAVNEGSEIVLYADDSKCFRVIKTFNDALSLQSDLDYLSSWSKTWDINFNEKNVVLYHSVESTIPSLSIIQLTTRNCQKSWNRKTLKFWSQVTFPGQLMLLLYVSKLIVSLVTSDAA